MEALATNLGEAVAAERRVERYHDERRAVGFNAAGLSLLASGQYGDAAERFRRAADLAPDRPEPRFNLAVALLMSDNIDAAAREASDLLQRFPSDPQVRELAGSAELAARKPDRAAALLPDKGEGGGRAAASALALLLAGRAEEARARFAALARHDPALERLGFALH